MSQSDQRPGFGSRKGVLRMVRLYTIRELLENGLFNAYDVPEIEEFYEVLLAES